VAFEFDFEDTSQIEVPSSLLEQVIGQDEAVLLARLIAKQKRNLLLIGPPGTGKSMIAQAISALLPPPKHEVSVLHNPAKPERPILEVRTWEQVEQQQKAIERKIGTIMRPEQAPAFVAERLGFKCRSCGRFSSADASICPACGRQKFRAKGGPFDDLIAGKDEPEREDSVTTTRLMEGKEDLVVFERLDSYLIRAMDSKDMARMEKKYGQIFGRNVLLGLERPVFVQATGASETELLGDVRHDPYGGHAQIGTPPYLRVVPGAIHEAHEGVLFVDEIISLGRLQRHLLTAMQEKKFPITGRNASSTGASVRVDGVPCDFILVAAVNTSDVARILPPLRSRISGNGYELLLNSTMPDTKENRKKLARFCAQEVKRDGRIPHMQRKAVEAIVEEARRRARVIDQKAGLTLRLRSLSGIIKVAGDLAVSEGAEKIEEKHIREALKLGKSAEEQIMARFGSHFKASMSDWGIAKEETEDRSIG
jgi:ATP-dependent Lon protease